MSTVDIPEWKSSRLGPGVQEMEDHNGAAQDTDYRNTSSKLQSGHPVPVNVMYGELKASEHQQQEV